MNGVSEAEPRRQNRGISGGREALAPGISAEWGGVDSSVEGASSLEGDGDGLPSHQGLLVPYDRVGFGRRGRMVRQGASVTRSRGLRKDRQGPVQVMSGPDG